MIRNPMENTRILSPDLVGVLETLMEVAKANKLRTPMEEVVARINNLKDPTELRGETNLAGKINGLKTPTELAGKIKELATPIELIAGISNLEIRQDALVDLWTSASKSALPFLPESSVLVFLDVQKDALEIKELSIPALIKNKLTGINLALSRRYLPHPQLRVDGRGEEDVGRRVPEHGLQ